ncbi:hypothetical protein [Bacillus sp. RAR_GA_16]|uniref:hypothetical protein n=1 Tax=Bacillus sp. RAR_GA_16 TaxID=2876774 RepID=UPI001CCF9CDF|nr:hypothetical protein [Bacillus sp. RAR_GA_16]MCA0172312.1 hypothetical protein [Bacillus sp. RAR_GA_16]
MNTVFVFGWKGEVTECLPTAAGSMKSGSGRLGLTSAGGISKEHGLCVHLKW